AYGNQNLTLDQCEFEIDPGVGSDDDTFVAWVEPDESSRGNQLTFRKCQFSGRYRSLLEAKSGGACRIRKEEHLPCPCLRRVPFRTRDRCLLTSPGVRRETQSPSLAQHVKTSGESWIVMNGPLRGSNKMVLAEFAGCKW